MIRNQKNVLPYHKELSFCDKIVLPDDSTSFFNTNKYKYICENNIDILSVHQKTLKKYYLFQKNLQILLAGVYKNM